MTRWPLLMGLVFLTACESMEESAKTTFSSEKTCPSDRVEARVRSDLKPSSFATGTGSPPPDIAADPGRLKMWQDQRASASASEDDLWTIVEARGCNLDAFYKCKLPQGGNGHPRYLCMTESHVPSAISTW